MPSENQPRMFSNIDVIGQLPPEQQADTLRELGDPTTADEIAARPPTRRGGATRGFFGGPPKLWQHTAHQFGYVAPRPPGVLNPQPIVYPGAIDSDASLKNQRINIHLNRLRVQDYPGGGEHLVMFTFKAQNQIPDAVEPVSFNQSYRVREGQTAGIAGYPIFIGLNVGGLGIAFQCFTMNVKNRGDERVLEFLDSDPFRSGLNLLTTAQPALRPLSEMALGMTRILASRNQNVAVQDFFLGLDFTGASFGVRLAEGDYIAAQVPSEDEIKWDDWVFNPNIGAIASKGDQQTALPYNYVVFGVSRYEG